MPPWICDVCNTSMSINNRDAHIAGQKHTKKVAKVASSSIAAASPSVNTTPTPSSAAQAHHHVPVLQPIWRCDVCSLDLNVNDKNSHLTGKKHSAKVKASTLPSAPSTSTGRGRGVTTGGITVGSSKSHDCGGHSGRGGRGAPGRGSGGLPRGHGGGGPGDPGGGGGGSSSGGGGGPGRGKSRGSSRRGRGRGRDRGRGRGDDGGYGGPGGWGAWAQEEGEDAPRYGLGFAGGRRRYLEDLGPGESFDQDDLAGILYDIDTAFGLLPHGGAYKESNFYNDYGDIIG